MGIGQTTALADWITHLMVTITVPYRSKEDIVQKSSKYVIVLKIKILNMCMNVEDISCADVILFLPFLYLYICRNAFKPDDPSCHLSPFSASRFLKCMSNRKITFIGDSLARNQYDSLLCLLSSHDHADRPDTLTATISHFQRYNFTAEAQFSYWRDYLMPRDIPSLSKESHDIVIVSTGAHW